jgi:hypothetical protein
MSDESAHRIQEPERIEEPNPPKTEAEEIAERIIQNVDPRDVNVFSENDRFRLERIDAMALYILNNRCSLNSSQMQDFYDLCQLVEQKYPTAGIFSPTNSFLFRDNGEHVGDLI